jgi:hypothetical protein
MLPRVALERTDISEELNILEDVILHSHRRENFKSYKDHHSLQMANKFTLNHEHFVYCLTVPWLNIFWQ